MYVHRSRYAFKTFRSIQFTLEEHHNHFRVIVATQVHTHTIHSSRVFAHINLVPMLALGATLSKFSCETNVSPWGIRTSGVKINCRRLQNRCCPNNLVSTWWDCTRCNFKRFSIWFYKRYSTLVRYLGWNSTLGTVACLFCNLVAYGNQRDTCTVRACANVIGKMTSCKISPLCGHGWPNQSCCPREEFIQCSFFVHEWVVSHLINHGIKRHKVSCRKLQW